MTRKSDVPAAHPILHALRSSSSSGLTGGSHRVIQGPKTWCLQLWIANPIPRSSPGTGPLLSGSPSRLSLGRPPSCFDIIAAFPNAIPLFYPLFLNIIPVSPTPSPFFIPFLLNIISASLNVIPAKAATHSGIAKTESPLRAGGCGPWPQRAYRPRRLAAQPV